MMSHVGTGRTWLIRLTVSDPEGYNGVRREIGKE